MYDLVIIGGGAAGLTAAVYAARAGLDFVILEQDGWGGGQITSAHTVENYPGLPNISGADLGEAIKSHAVSLGAKIVFAIVDEVRNCADYKEILLHSGDSVRAKTVIAATGASPRKLGVDGEKTLLGRGVSYCAVCDGAFFEGKDVFVIGGGDTAVEDALYLSSICKSVTLVHRRDVFRAPKTRVELLREKDNVNIICNATLNKITGEERVDGADIQTADGNRHMAASAVFIAVGSEPATAYLSGLPLDFDNGYVVAGEDCKTAVGGIFAAGDIRKKQLRQLVTAVADGANAVAGVTDYLKD